MAFNLVQDNPSFLLDINDLKPVYFSQIMILTARPWIECGFVKYIPIIYLAYYFSIKFSKFPILVVQKFSIWVLRYINCLLFFLCLLLNMPLCEHSIEILRYIHMLTLFPSDILDKFRCHAMRIVQFNQFLSVYPSRVQ